MPNPSSAICGDVCADIASTLQAKVKGLCHLQPSGGGAAWTRPAPRRSSAQRPQAWQAAWRLRPEGRSPPDGREPWPRERGTAAIAAGTRRSHSPLCHAR